MTKPEGPETEPPGQGADIAGVAVRPPVMLLGCLIAVVALEQFVPTSFAFDGLGTLSGIAVCFAAIVIFIPAVRRFSRAGTSVQTSQPSTAIVNDGIYSYSRNPIYLSMCTMMAGLSLLLDSLWVLLTLAVIVPVLRFGVIAREEIYLERKFGSAYTDYKKQVRRWV